MLIRVMHETRYSYDAPAAGVIQMLRLTPRNHAGQYVVDWRIDVSADCRLEPQEDAFGNIVHAFSTGGPLADLQMLVEGEVETQDTAGVVNGAVERFPPSLYLRETALTRPDEAITAYAAELRSRVDAGPGAPDGTLATLHNLLRRLHEDIAWDLALQVPAGAAAAAFAARRGACQDITHVFIAAARSLGIPARYVGGYLCSDGDHGAPCGAPDSDPTRPDSSPAVADGEGARIAGQEPAGDTLTGHAWAEAHVPGLGWVGFDPAGGLCVTDRHVRVAIGLDQLGAAQVRGAHFGGGPEARAVKLAVSQARWQTQG